jgi:hypothetical protein
VCVCVCVGGWVGVWVCGGVFFVFVCVVEQVFGDSECNFRQVYADYQFDCSAAWNMAYADSEVHSYAT